mmetsp:Transcript_3137/g.11240  ORF Transcript_3137/g.11240 Transcript_3137/m.11240 type:complete len:247 (+) Transcript_3137:851-1591(+)
MPKARPSRAEPPGPLVSPPLRELPASTVALEEPPGCTSVGVAGLPAASLPTSEPERDRARAAERRRACRDSSESPDVSKEPRLRDASTGVPGKPLGDNTSPPPPPDGESAKSPDELPTPPLPGPTEPERPPPLNVPVRTVPPADPLIDRLTPPEPLAVLCARWLGAMWLSVDPSPVLWRSICQAALPTVRPLPLPPPPLPLPLPRTAGGSRSGGPSSRSRSRSLSLALESDASSSSSIDGSRLRRR